MHRIIKHIHQTYIHPIDPGFFVTRYAIKGALAAGLALVTGYVIGLGDLLPWCAYGAFAMIIFRAGATFESRKAMARRVIFGAAALVPFSTAVSGVPLVQELYVFALAFCAFFSGTLGATAVTVSIGILLVNLLTIGGDPAGFSAGITRALTVIFGGGIAYAVNFHIWPIRPGKILSRAGAVALADIGIYFEGVANNLDSKDAPKKNAELNKRAVASIRRYRRYMEAMNIDPVQELDVSSGPTAFYSVLIRMMESVVSLSNSSRFATTSPLFKGVKASFLNISQQAVNNFTTLAQNLDKEGVCSPLTPLGPALIALENDLLDLGAYKKGDNVKEEFLEAWGAIHAIRNLVEELEEAACLRQGEVQ